MLKKKSESCKINYGFFFIDQIQIFFESFCIDCCGLWWIIYYCVGKKDMLIEMLFVFVYLFGNESSLFGNGLCI